MKHTYLEEIFEHKGYRCACVFIKTGHRCGYVAVDKTHPWYQVDYDNKGPNSVLCHYGLTYAGYGKHFSDEDGLWWFGFDCAHGFDGVDCDTAKEYGLVDDEEYLLQKKFADIVNSLDGVTMKDVEFVKDNCKMIVEQLVIAEKRG